MEIGGAEYNMKIHFSAVEKGQLVQHASPFKAGK